MAIAFRSKTNTSYGSTTNTVLTAPAGLADGDIMVAVIFVGSGSAPSAPTPPAGWASFGTATTATAGGFFTNFSIFWKRASSESGSYTFTHATYSSQGLLKAYSGCLSSGTPLSATSNNTGTGSTATGTSITTTAANSYLLFESHNWVGSGVLSPPTGMTERLDILVYSADELIVSAGATGTRTQSNGNGGGDAWAVRMVELLADTGGGGTTYNKTTAETASAAETADGLLTTTKAVAETAASAETATGLLTTTKAVAETAAAADAVGGLTIRLGAIAETAGAADATDAVVVLPGIIDVSVIETAVAVDTVDCSHIRSWRPAAAPLAAWRTQLPGLMERSTEVHARRITEAGATRILERVIVEQWTKKHAGSNSWTRL